MRLDSLFTQTAVLFCSRAPSADAVRAALADYPFRVRSGLDTSNPWISQGTEFLVAMRPEVGGEVVVDLVDRPWPDDWDDEVRDPAAFEAGAAGFFGPSSAPGAMARALQQPWGWPEAEPVVRGHVGLVRLRITYAIGQADAPIPTDRDPLAELHFLSGLAHRVGQRIEAEGVFFPAAESIRAVAQMGESLDLLHRERFLPLDIWLNTRLYHLEDLPEHALMDCIGMSQLELPDVEVLFPSESFELDDIDLFIREAAARLIQEGHPPAVGTRVYGPNGSRWVVMGGKAPLAGPDRSFVRLVTSEDVEMVMRAEFFAN